jgi:hypothetical protein
MLNSQNCHIREPAIFWIQTARKIKHNHAKVNGITIKSNVRNISNEQKSHDSSFPDLELNFLLSFNGKKGTSFYIEFSTN